MFDRQTSLTRVQPEPTARHPAASKARIKREGSIDYPYGGANVLAEIPECPGGGGERTSVARSGANSLLGKIHAFAPIRLPVFRPPVEVELEVAECRYSESRPVTRITLDRLAEQIKCGQCAFSFPSVSIGEGA